MQIVSPSHCETRLHRDAHGQTQKSAGRSIQVTLSDVCEAVTAENASARTYRPSERATNNSLRPSSLDERDDWVSVTTLNKRRLLRDERDRDASSRRPEQLEVVLGLRDT